MYSFIAAEFYVPQQGRTDIWTGEEILAYRAYKKRTVQPTMFIKRKAMLWPIRSGLTLLCIDLEPSLNDNKVICVPPCPKVNDFVKIKKMPMVLVSLKSQM